MMLVPGILLSVGLLHLPGEPIRAHLEITTDKALPQGWTQVKMDDPWSSFPLDSRELWKFRLTARH